MSKSKVVREIVEHVAPATKGAKAAEKLGQPITRASARRAIDDIMQEHNQSIEAMIQETDSMLRQADEDLFGPSADEIETIRRKMLVDPNERFENWVQSKTPEEYTERWQKQITDPGFSARSILEIHDPTSVSSDMSKVLDDWTAEVRRSQARDMLVQAKVSRPFRGDPRKMAFLEDWMEGSPYTRPGKTQPQVFFHVDRQSDPLAGKMEDLIQLTDEANEIGLHSGTMLAAERATYRDVQSGMAAHRAFDDWTSEIAGYTNLAPERVREIMATTLEDYMEAKFRTARSGRSVDLGDIFNDMEMELGPALVEAGLPVENTFQTLRALIRMMPIPDTTPHFFRGKNGLLMEDRGGWFPRGVKGQLKEIFEEDRNIIDSLPNETRAIREYIESKGYDHIVYNNSVEDKGMPSIIVWKPDLMMSLFDPRLAKGGHGDYAPKVLAGMVLGFLGIGEEDADLRTEL